LILTQNLEPIDSAAPENRQLVQYAEQSGVPGRPPQLALGRTGKFRACAGIRGTGYCIHYHRCNRSDQNLGSTSCVGGENRVSGVRKMWPSSAGHPDVDDASRATPFAGTHSHVF
jgi:hypothetical protein